MNRWCSFVPQKRAREQALPTRKRSAAQERSGGTRGRGKRIRSALPAGAFTALSHQKISEKKPITTSRPIKKMMPTVLPRNFNMGVSP
ncbi:hypothetical protein [Pseudomonas sp. GD03944]|uniref:hypothetical protein n=1 Tax=Pseudomonas sp. GD03944 TaxID=2975409 RepID=UPI00244CE0B4|nr:hypothetical protein [Pseudomonas sp. GD03944]MDH1264730.1 hypothetical protein [Pseudomonas sp. GD03944]